MSKIVICDIDGTVANNSSISRMTVDSYYTPASVAGLKPNKFVIGELRQLHNAGYEIKFVTGRSVTLQPATLDWIAEHIPFAYDFDNLYHRGKLHHDMRNIMKLKNVVNLIMNFTHKNPSKDLYIVVFDDDPTMLEAFSQLFYSFMLTGINIRYVLKQVIDNHRAVLVRRNFKPKLGD